MVPEPTVFELSHPGRSGYRFQELDVPRLNLDDAFGTENVRDVPPELPELSEPEVVRHFTRLAEMNHHVDRAMYPLGSCTMKYNPKINEDMAALAGFSAVHPEAHAACCQGAIALIYNLGRMLAEISGMDEVSLQPPAGASGELTGMLMIRAYHGDRGNPRRKVIVPDTAHGTNPASLTLAGFEAVQIASGPDGRIDTAVLAELVDDETAAFMITNPNTLGVFENRIAEIVEIVHGVGGLVYLDGANLNASLGIVRPGDLGFDVMHFNLHKTFSAPHGGGGPGSGPVGVKSPLAAYLPTPVARRDERKATGLEFDFDYDRPKSVGKVHSVYGNFLVAVKAYAYILTLGPTGLRRVAENAVLNANYLQHRLKRHYEVPYPGVCQHEFVLSASRQKEQGVKALDIAKRLLDSGLHAPTVYFPLIVKEALMIEPTETESRASLDRFADVMEAIAEECLSSPERVKGAPHGTPVGRLDESKAVRDLDVSWGKS
ncbi:MAG: aminomethyl-transferring glycine dehydrogenase subunit GcvPB [Candidatus Eisenbacteria bacterium]|nr:aminomethyl-transferring glycine dehydrogenase subunit GcvPB [Candidatus Eisenbacteria bacterium]